MKLTKFLIIIICFLCFGPHKMASASNHTFRCRVVTHTDESDGSGNYVNNNVDRTFDMLQIRTRYSDERDLIFLFGLNGANSLPSIRGLSYPSGNSNDTINAFPETIWWSELYETISPWHIRSLNPAPGLTVGGQHFTGGSHGYVNPETKINTPSAETVYYEYTADGNRLHLGDELECDQIECHIVTRIGSYNTLDLSTGTGTMALECRETYRFIADKVLYDVTFEALEDIALEEHYGLQIAEHNPYMHFFTDDGIVGYDTDLEYPDQVDAAGTPWGMYGEDKDGHIMFIRMSETDAFSGERNNNVKMFGRNYGPHNFKQYHYVYGNGNVKYLEKGEKDSYHGIFSFAPKNPSELLPDNPNLRLSGVEYDRDIYAITMHASIDNGYFHDLLYIEDFYDNELNLLPIGDRAIYVDTENPQEIIFHTTSLASGQHSIRIGYVVNDNFMPLTENISFTCSEPMPVYNPQFINIHGFGTVYTECRIDASDIKIIDLSGQEQNFSIIINDGDNIEMKLLNEESKILLIYSTTGAFNPIKCKYSACKIGGE